MQFRPNQRRHDSDGLDERADGDRRTFQQHQQSPLFLFMFGWETGDGNRLARSQGNERQEYLKKPRASQQSCQEVSDSLALCTHRAALPARRGDGMRDCRLELVRQQFVAVQLERLQPNCP